MASRVNWHASWIAVYVNDHGLGEYLVPLGLVSGGSTGHLVHQAGISRIRCFEPPAVGGPGET
ncbi:MAG: hypothetical protein EBY55_00255 [Gammaproteobacteria bacterium]|nr:hypothetical protein [Gammaproteobacteria bacterium]